MPGLAPLACQRPWVPAAQRSLCFRARHTSLVTRAADAELQELQLEKALREDGLDLRQSKASPPDRVRLEDMSWSTAEQVVEGGSERKSVGERAADEGFGTNGVVEMSSTVSFDIRKQQEEEGEKNKKQEDESDGFGNNLSGSLKGMLMLNLGAALFGSNQVVIKTTEESLSPGALSALRFVIAAAFFAPDMVKGFKDKELRNSAVELGFWLFAGYTAQAIGLFSTTAARGAFTGTFTVLAVPILVGLSGRRVPWTTWFAAVVAMSGVGLLTTSGVEANVGDLWCILSAIMFGVHKWRSEETTARFEDQTKELVALQIWVLMISASLYCAPEFLATVQDNGILGTLELAKDLPWGPLAFMGLGTSALTLLLEMEALKEVSAPLAALIYTAEPLWGALFAYFLLGERWGPTGWVGAAMIVTSSLMAQFAGDGDQNEEIKTDETSKIVINGETR